ncbi:hypothetical protein [Acutalibacter sp. JLR.KK004]
MLRLLLKMQLITQEEYERILEISAAHYSQYAAQLHRI